MDGTAIKHGVLAALAAAGSFIANQLGGWDAALTVLLCMMAIDYITGLLVGMVFHASPKTESGGLASGESYKGLVRKCMILVLVWVGAMLDRVIGGTYARTAVILFFVGNEGISILENIGLMGVPFPKFLKNALDALKEKGDEGVVE